VGLLGWSGLTKWLMALGVMRNRRAASVCDHPISPISRLSSAFSGSISKIIVI
jgi:hypothetical protein